MQYRDLGKTGLKTSIIGIGCGTLGSISATTSNLEACMMLEEALDLGITFFDTADIYGQGDSERLLGKVTSPRRSQIIIETKAGKCLSNRAKFGFYIKRPLGKLIHSLKGRSTAVNSLVKSARSRYKNVNFSSEYLTNALENSLRRLQSDYVDIFMLHNPPLDIIIKDEFALLSERLKQQGKIRAFGITCQDENEALTGILSKNVDVIQIPVGGHHRTKLQKAITQGFQQGVGIVGRSPFFGIDLSNKDEDKLRSNSYLTTAQKILCSATSHEDTHVVITGISSRKHLRENLKPFNA